MFGVSWLYCLFSVELRPLFRHLRLTISCFVRQDLRLCRNSRFSGTDNGWYLEMKSRGSNLSLVFKGEIWGLKSTSGF